ncbi:MAG: potassium/proton antiporter [Deltaproteobacteria bacterium]|nr:potassium/proton antiporter [Deltaproteobacteria bacterium]
MTIEQIIIIVALILVLSVSLSKVSDRFGVPALLLFLGIGMLIGSDGPGGIDFDNAWLSQAVGTVALVYILFSGGLHTDLQAVKVVIKPTMSLSILGVLITALITGACAKLLFGVSWREGLLIGSIVSSTDAAAVFAVLRSKNVSLKEPLGQLLELESGSNDPMAVFLTVGFIELLKDPTLSIWTLVPLFFQQMSIGLVAGYLMYRLFLWVVKRINLYYEGLYPVFSLGWVLLTYGITAWLGGSGFMAVYLAGIMMNGALFPYKKSLMRFHDGIAWLMQITMFLALGMLVYPSHLIPVAHDGLMISFVLIFLARPISVFFALAFSRFNIREKLLISWVGLRGSVPIVLATFPLLAGVSAAQTIFNLVFFIVIASVLLQGTTIPLVARWLKVDTPLIAKRLYPIHFESSDETDLQLVDFQVASGSRAAGQTISKLGLPRDSLITLVGRNKKYVMPSGNTVVEVGDILLVLVSNETLPLVREILVN